jgi:hypothetical protein
MLWFVQALHVGIAMNAAVEEQKQATPICKDYPRDTKRHDDGHPNRP